MWKGWFCCCCNFSRYTHRQYVNLQPTKWDYSTRLASQIVWHSNTYTTHDRLKSKCSAYMKWKQKTHPIKIGSSQLLLLIKDKILLLKWWEKRNVYKMKNEWKKHEWQVICFPIKFNANLLIQFKVPRSFSDAIKINGRHLHFIIACFFVGLFVRFIHHAEEAR